MLGYDSERQRDFLEGLLGQLDWKTLLLWLGGLFAAWDCCGCCCSGTGDPGADAGAAFVCAL
ncbi:MAG: hypothetical protein R3E95_17795 [Thiolinea sp.]